MRGSPYTTVLGIVEDNYEVVGKTKFLTWNQQSIVSEMLILLGAIKIAIECSHLLRYTVLCSPPERRFIYGLPGSYPIHNYHSENLNRCKNSK